MEKPNCFKTGYGGKFEDCRLCLNQGECLEELSPSGIAREYLALMKAQANDQTVQLCQEAVIQARRRGFRSNGDGRFEDEKAALKAIRSSYNQLLKQKRQEHLEAQRHQAMLLSEIEYGRPKRPERYRIPPRWMWDNKRIWRHRGHLITMLVMLYYRVFNHEESERLARDLVRKGTYGKDWRLGLWDTDKNGKDIFYPAALFQFPYGLVERQGLRMEMDLGHGMGRPGPIAWEMNWSRQKSHRVLDHMTARGIIWEVGSLGRGPKKVYCLGTILPGQRRINFLFRDDPSWRKVFEDFRCW